MIYVHPEISDALQSLSTSFDQIMHWQGTCYRHHKNRFTQKIVVGKKSYFLKQHFGLGWKEIFKNVSQGRLPILGAKQEWRAILRLKKLNISVPEIFGFGEVGFNPAKRQSFVLMQAIENTVSLEEFANNPEKYNFTTILKYKIIKEIARIARVLHTNGLYHRDFYLCHFLLHIPYGHQIKLTLIDLHRAGLKRRTATRWIVKDLGALYFSTQNILLSQRDFFYFMREYCQMSLRSILKEKKLFWEKVKMRGSTYRDHSK